MQASKPVWGLAKELQLESAHELELESAHESELESVRESGSALHSALKLALESAPGPLPTGQVRLKFSHPRLSVETEEIVISPSAPLRAVRVYHAVLNDTLP